MGRKETKEAPPAETRVSDLAVASYLLARDYDLIGIESAAGRVEFVFANVPTQVLLAFYGGDAVVNARKLLAAHRDLKGLILEHDRRRR